MALSPNTYRHISQVGVTRLIDASTGPKGPDGVTSYWLVPTSGYINGQRFPYEINEDLKAQSFDTTEVEGLEYWKVPENTNQGRLSHYAQLTGVAELQNPPGGGVNRVAETFENNSAAATVAPDAVEKYVSENDNYEEARKTQSQEDQRVANQVGLGKAKGAPAREPNKGDLVISDSDDDKPAKSVKPSPTKKS